MAITFPASPALNEEWTQAGVTWKWDSQKWVSQSPGGGGGGASVEVGETPPDPAGASEGDLFWSSTETNLYILYIDDDGPQWVEASPGGGGGGASENFWVRYVNEGQGTLQPADSLDNLEVGGDGLCVIGQKVGVGRHPTTEADDAQLQVGGDADVAGSITAAGDVKLDNWDANNTPGVFLSPNLPNVGKVLVKGNGADVTAIGVFIDGNGENNNVISLNGSGNGIFGDFNPSSNATRGIKLGLGPDNAGVSVQSKSTYPSSSAAISVWQGTVKTWSVTNGGTAGFRNAILNLEPDDSNNYVSTTNAEGETESVYSGPTLDVKDSILKLTAAMVAINQAANSASNLANLKEAIKTATADFMEAN